MRNLFSTVTVLIFAFKTQLSFAAENTLFEYPPAASSVSYSQLIGLPVASPNEIIPYGTDALQYGELWLPEESSTKPKVPLVILIHGGCWLNAYDIKHTHALSTELSQSGYAVWGIEYRRTGDDGGGWPGTYHDIQAAIEFTAKLDHQRVDTSKIALIGHSAGGHLALLAASELDMTLSAVIGLAPIIDIKKYAAGSNSCEAATSKFMGGTPIEKAEEYKSANPAVKTLHPKTLVIHGDADSIVPIEQSRDLQVLLRVVEGGGHFDMVYPGTLAVQKLKSELSKAFK